MSGNTSMVLNIILAVTLPIGTVLEVFAWRMVVIWPLSQTLQSATKFMRSSKNLVTTVWIGVYRNENDNFITVNGIQVSFKKWYPDQPNNFNDVKDCVELMDILLWKPGYAAGGRWNDVSCWLSNRYYVCERAAKIFLWDHFGCGSFVTAPTIT